MYDERYEQPERREEGPAIGIKDVVGFILVLIGSIIGLWVFFSAYSLFTDPQELLPFQELVSGELQAHSKLESNEADITVPPQFFSYIIPILLLMVCAGIAGMFVKGGVGLVYGSYQRFLNKLSSLELRMGKKIESIGEEIKKIGE